MMENLGVETFGIVQVGEIITRVQREAITEPDFSNAIVAGQIRAFQAVVKHGEDLVGIAGPYDDVRALQDLITWVRDRIREVQPDPSIGS